MPVSAIRKRDGRIVPFDQKKITEAIFMAAVAVGGKDRELAKRLSGEVTAMMNSRFNDKIPTVEDVQDIVEKVLIENGHARTSKAYILYRDQHSKIREVKTLFDSIEIVEDYVSEDDWRVKENANMSYSLQGLNNHIASRSIAKYWLKKIYPKSLRIAHQDGNLHIHDLSTLGAYCVGWDLQDLLLKGFKGVPTKIESAPAKHFRPALGQAVNFLYTLQGESAGAQAFSNFDTLLAPFIRYDKLDYKGVKQALQEFIFNVNVPTRVGFQCPFTNVTMDLETPKHFKDNPVLRGGKPEEECYGDFDKEMEIFNKAFAEIMMEGDSRGRIFSFPIPTYNLTKDFDWDNPAYDSLWNITAKYGIPYFSNFINSDMNPEDARSMCCRLKIDNKELRKRGGGLFGSAPKTGSIGVVTINMPRIGYLSEGDNDYFERLGYYMEIAKSSLEIKRKVLEKFTEKGLYPYSKYYLKDIKESQGGYWMNHFSTIGLIGMNESCLNFTGQNIATKDGQQFAVKVLKHMRSLLKEYQEETGNNYNLEATPGEGTSYRLAKVDRERFSNIITAGQEHPYYTNSTQLPVDHTQDLFKALDLQDELQSLYTGGTSFHSYLGERIADAESCKALVKKISHNYKMPYFSLTPTFSVCSDHGYLSGEQHKCHCGKACEVYSRIVGYYRPIQNWNKGKREEFGERKLFAVPAVTR